MTVHKDAKTFEGAVSFSGGSSGTVAATVTAAGTDITDAFALTAQINKVTTAAAGTGVKLPSATPIGGEVVVQNGGANDLEVYPPDASGTLNAGAAGVALTLAAATDQILIAKKVTATAWIALVGAGPAT